MVLVSVFLLVLPLSVQVVPSVTGFGIILMGLPIYILFVMDTPCRLRPKIFDRISGEDCIYTPIDILCWLHDSHRLACIWFYKHV